MFEYKLQINSSWIINPHSPLPSWILHSPHTFRHLASQLAFSKCRDGFDIKAVSQNFGHEHIGTTLITYGSLNNSQVGERVAGMDFSDKKEDNEDLANAIEKLIRDRKKGNFW